MLPNVSSFDFKAGVSVSDDHTSLSVDDITVTGTIQVPTVGTEHSSQITYTVSDAQGNETTVIRNILVTNYAPVFSGLDKITIPAGTTVDLGVGVTVTDIEDTSITFTYQPTVTSTLTAGTHYVEYTATDSDGNTTTLTREIEVQVNTAPIISGANDVQVLLPDVSTFSLLDGITITDDHTTLSVDDITVTGAIQVPTAGTEMTSIITYTVSDAQGNKTTVIRNILVTNYLPTISGLGEISIPEGTVVDLQAGITATDNEDSDITTSIVYPTIDTTTLSVGTHTVSYSVTDSDGNVTTLQRIIRVNDDSVPVIDVTDSQDNQTGQDIQDSEVLDENDEFIIEDITAQTDVNENTNNSQEAQGDSSTQSDGTNLEQGNAGFGGEVSAIYGVAMYIIIFIYMIFILILSYKKRKTGIVEQTVNILGTLALFVIQLIIGIFYNSNQFVLICSIFLVVIIIGNVFYKSTNTVIEK